jgi:hypothetical protein
MTEYERRGHWRTLQDGTRTWVSGHSVVRDPEDGHGYSADALRRRWIEKVEAAHASKEARNKARKARASIRKAKQLKASALRKAKKAFVQKLVQKRRKTIEEKRTPTEHEGKS